MGCCGGGGGDPGAEARQLEAERQANIKKGAARIDAVFAGQRGVNPSKNVIPFMTYYDEFGSPIDPLIPPPSTWKGRSLLNATNDFRTRQAELQQLAQAGKLFRGKESFGGFDDAFFGQRKQDYLNFAMPQLAQQQQGATKALSFALARQGLLRSGAAEQASRDLDRQAGLSLQQIVDQAAGQERQLRMDVEGQRSDLLNQLHATGDPQLAAQRAVATSANLRLPSPMAPIGQLFGDLTNQYVNKNLAGIWNQTAQGGQYGYRTPASPMPGQASRIIRG